MSAELATFDLNVKRSPDSITTFCSPPTRIMFEPGGIKLPVHKNAVFKLPDSTSFTSTNMFDCKRFETATPITVVVVATGVV